MLTGKEDLLQALIEAYLMEKGTKEFYSNAAEKAMSPEAKKVFTELSGWEEQHMGFIQFLYQSILDNRDIKTFEEFRSKADAPITESGIPVRELETRMEKHKFMDDKDALNLALEIEGKAYNLYRKLSKDAPDTNAKVIFKEMMEQEAKHIDYLKRLKTMLV